ncbi:hypothetical protein GDO86_010102 [Hymenochirus boettgeri]|uniref:G-protein coupled receptors family 1 profile domain-containing protein n=1 Tax=Hymenochirus boettgeri TaxID=247094 RepID=A0A8T2JS03_9PIPI|nr:hypothetical protein GDO86_010102 [Hymenochirus boettgeri]
MLNTMEKAVPVQTEMNAQLLKPGCLLIMIVAGKILINLFIFRIRHRKVQPKFLDIFCISLAAVDFALLAAISIIHYFQDFALCGMRFSNYHICLFTQIISNVYGILHFPVFLAAGLDYYLTLVNAVNVSRFCLYLFYVTTVLIIWFAAFFWALTSTVSPNGPDPGLHTFLCTFYISNQTYYLSATVVFTIILILAICCFELVAFMKSLKIVSFTNEIVVQFSCGGEWPIRGNKWFLTALLITFLATWTPFVILQVVVLILCAQIPGYMDMNVAWIYFMNSFLVGVAYFLKCQRIELPKETFSVDPFISWKYCVLPFIDTSYKVEDNVNGQPTTIMII